MTATLPPHVELERVVTGLLAHLRSEWSAVLADDRWAEARESVARLSGPSVLPPLASDLGPARCRRLTELLLDRWAALGAVELPPAAAVLPDGDSGLALVVDGLADGWQATWTGPVQPLDPAGSRVRLVGADDPARVAVRVFGRAAGGRTILAATWDRPGVPDASG